VVVVVVDVVKVEDVSSVLNQLLTITTSTTTTTIVNFLTQALYNNRTFAASKFFKNKVSLVSSVSLFEQWADFFLYTERSVVSASTLLKAVDLALVCYSLFSRAPCISSESPWLKITATS